VRWRAYLRLTAIFLNGLFVMWLIGVGGWWMPVDSLGGLPLIVLPMVTLIALTVAHRKSGD
jgi:hypothetical protein